MRASTGIQRLQYLQKVYGDMEVFLDVSPDGLIEIGLIDVDAEDTGIMIWRKEDV